jgi:hypothetical protein
LKVAHCDYPYARWMEPQQILGKAGGDFPGEVLGEVAGHWSYESPDGATGELGLGPATEIEAWLSDVAQVTVLARMPIWAELPPMHQHLEAEMWHWSGYNEEAWNGMGPVPVKTLVMARFADNSTRVLLVERAWLLSETGQTIERIAP